MFDYYPLMRRGETTYESVKTNDCCDGDIMFCLPGVFWREFAGGCARKEKAGNGGKADTHAKSDGPANDARVNANPQPTTLSAPVHASSHASAHSKAGNNARASDPANKSNYSGHIVNGPPAIGAFSLGDVRERKSPRGARRQYQRDC